MVGMQSEVPPVASDCRFVSGRLPRSRFSAPSPRLPGRSIVGVAIRRSIQWASLGACFAVAYLAAPRRDPFVADLVVSGRTADG